MNTLRFPKWLTLSTILLFISILTSHTSNAQTGSVKGTLIDSTSEELIFGAIVSSPENPTIGTQSDMDGAFLISNITPGTYNFKVSYMGYKPHLYKDVVVVSGQTTDLGTVNLEIDADVPVIEIIGQISTNTEEAVVEEIKQSDNVVSGISSQQIQKGQDRDAAQALQRVPGVSIIDSRFIMIRGLNDRYNSVWLNNAPAPSSETDRKAFSFDMLPTGVIDRMLVYKTPSADLPGDFAGGFIKIYTITPKDKIFTINTTLGYRTGTTFKDFTRDKHSTDWLGIAGKDRDLSANQPVYTSANGYTDAQLNDYSKSFNNNWMLKTSKALPDGRLSAVYSNSRMLQNSSRFGVLASANYTNSNTTFNITRIDADGDGVATQTRKDQQFTNEVKIASMLNFSYIINEKNKIEFRNFFNQNGRIQTTLRNQYDVSENLSRIQYAISYRSRTIYTSQFEGDHQLKNDKTKIGWLIGYGYSSKNEPDLRRATYVPDSSDPSIFLIQPANNANDLTNGGRLFQNLNENSGIVSLNLTQKLNIKAGKFEFAELEAGSYNTFLSRDFQARAFANTLQGGSKGGTFWNDTLQSQPIDQVYAQGNMINGKGWTILEENNPTYKYHATNRLSALFLSGKFNVGSKIKLITGLRFENNSQYIESAINGAPIKDTMNTNFFLPSVNFAYNFTPKSLVRLAYGKTLNRPEFREFAPFYFYDFDFNAVNYGSLYFGKSLNVCKIQNFDLRYEYYPSAQEMISVALFYKHFTDPIEQIALATSGGSASALAYTYVNAESAYNVGFELEARKNLAFITEKAKNFSLLFNATVIKSQVTIPEGQSDYWNKTRNLQGQSPYMLNLGLYYQEEKSGWSGSVLFNTFGDRIVIVGNSNYPDVIEKSRGTLDLSITKQISRKVALNAGIIDLINQSVTWIQDYNRDGKYQRHGSDNIMLTYKKGTVYTLMLRLSL